MNFYHDFDVWDNLGAGTISSELNKIKFYIILIKETFLTEFVYIWDIFEPM